MPLDNEKLKKIYSTLQQGGYGQDYDSFVKGFTGNDHYENRKKVYDLLTENGARIGDTYEDFMRRMQVSTIERPTDASGANGSVPSVGNAENGGGHANGRENGNVGRPNDADASRQDAGAANAQGSATEPRGGGNGTEQRASVWQSAWKGSDKSASWFTRNGETDPGDQPLPAYRRKSHGDGTRLLDGKGYDSGRHLAQEEKPSPYLERPMETNAADLANVDKDAYFSPEDGYGRMKIEDERINREYTPRKVESASDVAANYLDKFRLTQEGSRLTNEYADAERKVTDKYLRMFHGTDEYKELADKYEEAAGKYKGAELEKATGAIDKEMNTVFRRMYGDAVANDMQPYNDAYYKAVYDRYGSAIEAGQNAFIKKQVGDKVARLNDRLVGEIGRLEARIKSEESEVSRKREAERAELERKIGANPYAADEYRYGSLRQESKVKYSEGYKRDQKDLGLLEMARRLNGKSVKMIDEAAKKGSSWYSALGRGLRDATLDVDTWSFGVTEMNRALNLKAIVEKADRGEKLTKGEEALLDACVTNLATEAYYASDLSSSYNAGQTTGASLPFMLEFAVNPVSASGSSIAKGILKYGMKKFGKAAVKRSVAKMGARLVGDAAAAAAMTGTSGAARVAAGTIERQTGDIQFATDDKGDVRYDGRENRQGFGKALAKSFASTFLENQSEMIFNAFKGTGGLLLGKLEKAAPGLAKGISQSSAAKVYREVMNNKGFKELVERTQFHGYPEEYMEEVYNNFANVALGEMSLEDATSVETNLETMYGLAPTSVAFGVIGLGGLGRQRYRTMRNRRNMEREFLSTLTAEELQEIDGLKDSRMVKEYARNVMRSEELTPEQKKAKLKAAYNRAERIAEDEIREEQTPEQNAADDAYINGAEQNPVENYRTERSRAELEGRLNAVDGNLVRNIGELVDEDASATEVENLMDGLDAETAATAREYYHALLAERGAVDGALDDADELADGFDAALGNVADADGNVTTATYKGEPVYVTGTDGENATITRADGSREMVLASHLGDMQTAPAAQLSELNRRQAQERAQEGLAERFERHPNTREPETGMQLWNGDTPYIIGDVGQEADGTRTVTAYPAALDGKTGQLAPKNGSGPVELTYDEAIQLQNDYYDRMDAANGAQEDGTETSIVDNTLGNDNENASASPTGDGNVSNNQGNKTSEYTLSERKAGNGERFYQDENGNIDLARVPDEVFNAIGYSAAPFRLSPSMIAHMLDRHGKELGFKTEQEAIKFVLEVMNGFDHVRLGYDGALVFSIENGRRRIGKRAVTVLINSDNGEFYGLKTSGYESINGLEKRPLLWERGANDETSSTDAASANVTTSKSSESGEQSGSASNQGNDLSENKGNDVQGETQAAGVESALVLKKDGTPDFAASGEDVSLRYLAEKYKGKAAHKIEVTRKAAETELGKAERSLDKAQQAYDDAPIGKEEKAEAALNKARQAYGAAKREADFWTALDGRMKAELERPGDATARDILQMDEPMNGEELAARMLGNGVIKLLQPSFMEETGYGSEEAKKYFGLFASKEKGGMSIRKAGERLMEMDREDGTNFFDQSDPNAGRAAILEVLAQARTRGELADYVRRNRERMAERERDAEYAAYEQWCAENFKMTPEEYEAYERDYLPLYLEEMSRLPQAEIDAAYAEYIENLNEERHGNERNDYGGTEAVPGERVADGRGTDGGNAGREAEAGGQGLDEGGLVQEAGVQAQGDGRVREAHVGLSESEADELLSRMEAAASDIPQIELNPTNWVGQFGETGMVSTPMGEVKMGENQIAKLFEKGRSEQFGMIKPTLETPQAVIEVPSEASDGKTERGSSLLFVKTFHGKDGKKVYYFKSVTVRKDGMEVSVSSHYDRAKRVKEALEKGKLLYRFDGGAQTEHRPADVSVTASPSNVQGNVLERPLLWERGANAIPEDVATPTITTIEPQQGDERTSRAKSQSNVSAKNDIVWPEPTMGSNANTDIAEVADSPTEVAKGETVDRGGNSSQPISSLGKGMEESAGLQGKGKKSARRDAVEPYEKYNLTNEEAGLIVAHGIMDWYKEATGEVQGGTQGNGTTPSSREGLFEYAERKARENREKEAHDTQGGRMEGRQSGQAGAADLTKAVKRLSAKLKDRYPTSLYLLGRDIQDMEEELSATDISLTPKKIVERIRAGIERLKPLLSEYERLATPRERNWSRLKEKHPGAIVVIDMGNGKFQVAQEDVRAVRNFIGAKYDAPVTENLVVTSGERYGMPFTTMGVTSADLKSLSAKGAKYVVVDADDFVNADKAEYAGVKKETVASSPAKAETKQAESKGYSIAPSTYTNKKGKTSDVSLLTFDHDLTADQERAVKEFAKERTGEGRFAPARGWKDRESGGWMFRSEEDARKAAEMVGDAESVADKQPLGIADLREAEDAPTRDNAQEGILEYAERVAGQERAKKKAEEDVRMVHDAVGKTYTREAVTEYGNPYTETMTLLSTDGKMVEADMNTVGYGGHYSMPIEKAAEELNDKGWVEQTVSADGATPTFGRYQKAYDDFVDGIENKGMLPDTKALKGKLAQAKRRLSTLDKGAALGIKNEEDLHRHEAAMEDAKQMRDAFQAMLDYVNKRVKENEAKPKSEKPKKNPSGNRLVTDERYEELKKRMKAKLRGQMNMGIDPEILAIGTEMAVYHIEKGARKFADYARGMIADLGDEIRPYLKAFYNGARDLPEVEEMGLAKNMTSYDEVRVFDVANFDKESVNALATAEQVVAEQETARQAEEAKKKITAQRNEKRKERNLRDATEEDLEQNPVVYYKGEPHRILMVEHEGTQVGALAFSKPKITGVYLENGKEVQLSDLQVEDNDMAVNNPANHDENSEIHRTFAMAVKNDMLSSLDNGTKRITCKSVWIKHRFS